MIFSVVRGDLVYRVEQRLDGRSKDDPKIDLVVLLEFSEFGKAKSALPAGGASPLEETGASQSPDRG